MVYDRWLVITTLILVFSGLLMVTSASMVISDKEYHYPFHYLIHQGLYLGVGLFSGIVVSLMPIAFWQKVRLPLMLIALLLLILVLIPGIGHTINGSRRWIFIGPLSFQVSEVTKLCALLYLAGYLSSHLEQVQTQWLGFVKPLLLLMIVSALLLAEPDYGGVAILCVMFLGLLFVAGVSLWPFIFMLVFVALFLTLLAIISPYRMMRLTSFLNPWHSQYGSGYQLTQSLIAFGRGGVFGVGLGNSVQKLFYLPEAHTDFLFAVIAEELGLAGVIFLVICFTALIGRIFYMGHKIQRNKEDLFSAYIAYGGAIWLGLQGMINMGVNAGILPTKGLTLPFISYGGSSLLVNCLLIGIMLRIANNVRLAQFRY